MIEAQIPSFYHQPVLATAVIDALAPSAGKLYVDATFGGGGYARELLDRAECRLIAFDQDPRAIAAGKNLAAQFADRLTLIHARFSQLAPQMAARAITAVDGIMYDLGVSSPQLDDQVRGFSFRIAGPLDMRMGMEGPSAADLIRTLSESELANLIFQYGEERHSRRVARRIVAARAQGAIEDTAALATLVRSAVPPSRDGIDPATRTFQALRIAVNNELGELSQGLAAAEQILAPQGRLAVVTFHSLEDRIVKHFMRAGSEAAPQASRHSPGPIQVAPPRWRILTKRPIVPSAAEIAANPRARSAKLRVAERLAS